MLDVTSVIKTAGYLGVGAIIFAESGLLVGVILPGDSVLFTAGFLASQGYLHIVPLVIICFLAAIVGDNVGYWFGRRFGPTVFSKTDSRFLNKKHIERARVFYEKHGVKTIILARFIPVVRTLAPILAGVGSMEWKIFSTYNLIGGLIWGVGITLLGFWSGNLIPNADKYILPVAGLIIILSLIPVVYQFLGSAKNRELAWTFVKNIFSR